MLNTLVSTSQRTDCPEKRTALFWVITQRVVVISYRRFGTTYQSHPQGSRGPLNPEDGTDKLSRNVGKKLPLLAAW